MRAGVRTLLHMDGSSLRVQPGDRIGLVGRNGAGKTTLTKVLSGTLDPSEGSVEVTGELGYLPQDTHSGEDTEPVLARILSARGLDGILRKLRRAEEGLQQAVPEAVGSYIEYIGVTRAARGRGAAKGLLHAVIRDAAERGREFVDLEVDADSPTNAHEIYSAMGWRTKYATETWHAPLQVPQD